jgi:hypothetical protein
MDAFIYEKMFQHHKLTANFVNYVRQDESFVKFQWIFIF